MPLILPGGDGAFLVDVGTTAVTATGSTWRNVDITISPTPSSLALALSIATFRHRAQTTSSVYSVSENLYMTSISNLRFAAWEEASGRNYAPGWQIIEMPKGSVQRGITTAYVGSTGLTYVDITVSAVSDTTNALIYIDSRSKHLKSDGDTNHVVHIYNAELTSATNLRIYMYAEDVDSYYIPWQIWDPEG